MSCCSCDPPCHAALPPPQHGCLLSCYSPQVPISCLQWEHRLPLILQEVREADADIICLQELNHFGEHSCPRPTAPCRNVQQSSRGLWRRRRSKLRCLSTASSSAGRFMRQGGHFTCWLLSTVPAVTVATDVLAAALVPEGYSCFFRAKKPSPATKFGFPADGIALFYRHKRFSCSPAPEGAQAGCQARHSHLLGAELVGVPALQQQGYAVAWIVTVLTSTSHCCAVLCCAAVLAAVQRTVLSLLTATQQLRGL